MGFNIELQNEFGNRIAAVDDPGGCLTNSCLNQARAMIIRS